MNVAADAKADMVLAIQLAARHRAVRLSALLAAVGLLVARDSSDPLPALLLAAGAVGATAASRPLAPGPAFFLARRAAIHPLRVVLGRLAGVWLFILAVTAAGLPLVIAADQPAAASRMLAVAIVAGGALATPVLALSPLIGASGSAGLGLLGAMLGHTPPSTVAALLAPWPPARRTAVFLWNTLPLPWRAEHWMATGHPVDMLVVLSWVVIGVALAAWALVDSRRAV